MLGRMPTLHDQAIHHSVTVDTPPFAPPGDSSMLLRPFLELHDMLHNGFDGTVLAYTCQYGVLYVLDSTCKCPCFPIR